MWENLVDLHSLQASENPRQCYTSHRNEISVSAYWLRCSFDWVVAAQFQLALDTGLNIVLTDVWESVRTTGVCTRTLNTFFSSCPMLTARLELLTISASSAPEANGFTVFWALHLAATSVDPKWSMWPDIDRWIASDAKVASTKRVSFRFLFSFSFVKRCT